METKEDKSGTFEAQLRAWGAELDKLKAQADRKIGGAKKEYLEEGKELRQEIEAHLLKWGYEMEELKSKVKPEARKILDELRVKQQALKGELVAMKGVSEAAWKDVKTGFGKAWEEYRAAVTRHFK